VARKRTDFIVIHCSATPPNMDIGAKEIDRWHRAQGWLKIGYHFVIRRNGEVEIGRDLMEPGAHAQGINEKSIGICLVGGVAMTDGKATKGPWMAGAPEANFTLAQWETLDQLVADMQSQFPKAKVIGHREVSRAPKACPSFDVQRWLKEFRPGAAPTAK
jgi:N-acetylmuramoyl-L-alanine amidase